MRTFNRAEELLEFIAGRQRGFRKILEEADVIVSGVEARGERALLEYALKFDGLRAESAAGLLVPESEIKKACGSVGSGFLASLEKAVKNVGRFHREQLKRRKGFAIRKNGFEAGELVLPVESAGLYIPGGKAAYPSSAVMNAVPAKVAGVRRIIAATPPSPDGKVNPFTLAALHASGVSRIYRMGGAHAVAAMAFGAGIPRVRKIAGPGSAYVAAAKLLVQQKTSVGIDSPAGPTEVVLIADSGAEPSFVSADLVAQAEHGPDSMSVLISTSISAAKRITKEAETRAEASPRKKIIEKCLEENSAWVVVNNLSEALALSDRIAPEHLGLHIKEPGAALPRVRNAGAVFLGGYSPESAGDYFAGPNHVLPTSGRAVYSSPLGVDDFLKRTNYLHSGKQWLSKASGDIIRLAEAEGLYAHAEAVRVRMAGKKGEK